MTGFLNLDKEEGMTSAFAVNKVKRLTRTPCGHMGTLDPLASGVLPVGVGNATRLFNYFLEKKKTYRARFRFGATTATLDGEAEVIYGGSVPSAREIEGALPALTGRLLQVPPLYSAKSVNGKRGYELARAGEAFDLPPKEVEVFSFRLIAQTAPDEFSFEIVCGGGTYIRSLARDLAAALGTQGYMSGLRRTASGIFTEENAVKPSVLTAENVEEYLIPTEIVLPYPRLEISDSRLYNGLKLPCDREDGLYKLFDGEKFYGLARVEKGFVGTEKKLC